MIKRKTSESDLRPEGSTEQKDVSLCTALHKLKLVGGQSCQNLPV